MSNKEATKAESWWVIFIVVFILFICDLFIIDPIPIVDELILLLGAGSSLVIAIKNTIQKR